MQLAELTFTTPAGRELTVVTGVDTADQYYRMGYTLVREFDDGWLPEDMVPVEGAPDEGEAPAELTADPSEDGSEADDNQEGID